MTEPGKSKQLAALTPLQERILGAFVRPMTWLNVAVFRATAGRLGSRFRFGAPVLLLTTVGRRSGQNRTVALIYAEEGDALVLVASKGGSASHPLWYWNLEANPECEVQIGSQIRSLRARRASDEEKAKLWPKLNDIYREYEDYQARTDRNIPVMVLEPRQS